MTRRQNRQNDETVRGEYASGTGWEAGMRAPSTKYVDMDGNVSDDEPKGGGHVLVAEGDTVHQHMLDAMKAKTAKSEPES
jgi:hypothetical protein